MVSGTRWRTDERARTITGADTRGGFVGGWRRASDRVAAVLPLPLDRVRSIKLELAVLMTFVGGLAFGYFRLQIGWLPPMTTLAAMVIALVSSQFLAHGITMPLREMTAAAQRMARGDYTSRVRASSRDEVGQLAEAFNRMADDLAAADQQRRDLIANVSHKLRTPSPRWAPSWRTWWTGYRSPIRKHSKRLLRRPNGSGDSSPNCSTSRVSRRAPFGSTAANSPSHRFSRKWWPRWRS